MTDTLLPCPFCGKNEIRDNGDPSDNWIWCMNGKCAIYDIEIRREQWNRRPAPWQPIATAPKDGTVVDLWWKGQRMTGCWWNITMEKWTDDRSGLFYKPDPSHWMPSPPDPK